MSLLTTAVVHACKSTQPSSTCTLSFHFHFHSFSSWSPEGTFLAVPNSVNNGVFVAGILKRKDWAQATSLIGHENVVDVTVSLRIFFNAPQSQSNRKSLISIRLAGLQPAVICQEPAETGDGHESLCRPSHRGEELYFHLADQPSPAYSRVRHHCRPRDPGSFLVLTIIQNRK